MVDVWLIIVTIVCFLLMVILNIFTMLYYLHPDDKGFINGCFEKVIIVVGSTVLWAFVLLLPLDIANSRGDGSGFNIETVYVILFIIYLCFLVILLPFVSFFYDTDTDNTCCIRFFKSLIYTILMAVIVIILGLIAWGIVNKGTIDCKQKIGYISNLQSSVDSTTVAIVDSALSLEPGISYQSNLLIVAIIFILFLGWFLFIIFGGIGMIALPLDLIIDYIHRLLRLFLLILQTTTAFSQKNCTEKNGFETKN